MSGYLIFGILSVLILCCGTLYASPGAVIENSFFRYEIGADGSNLKFVEKKTGTNYLNLQPKSYCASIQINGTSLPANKVEQNGDKITVSFENSDFSAVLRSRNRLNHTILEVVDTSGSNVDSLIFLNIPLTLKATPDETFATAALALNLQTRVIPLPGPMNLLRAECYSHIGLKGSQVAVLGCASDRMRAIMKLIVAAAPNLPHSNLGGPFALDAVENKESYLIDWEGMTLENVDGWIRVAKKLGVKQFDFNAGTLLRHGDFRPNPKLYPNGLDDLKKVIDKLHAEGIKVGLHTYSCFIAKDSAYTNPTPDPRLAKAAAFTLKSALTADSTEVFVEESTESIDTTTGFYSENSLTLQIDDELITFNEVTKNTPFKFTQCQRGAYGTTPTTHATSAKVYRLKEMYSLFVPGKDTGLQEEIALRTAELYNYCGFDMIYLDAIDGMFVIAGPDTWHYASKFVFDITKNLKKAAIVEMSDMHHHFWYVRSRAGAWDVSSRGQKPMIDLHILSNQNYKRSFLPAQLGWWIVYPWRGVQPERTFPDEIEYLCCKALATGSGLSFWRTFSVEEFEKSANWARLSDIIRKYEELKLTNYFSDSIKQQLAAPGQEFTLDKGKNGRWTFYPINYDRQRVSGATTELTVENKYDNQPLALRLELENSCAPYDSPEAISLIDFDSSARSAFAEGVTADLTITEEQVKVGGKSGKLTALNKRESRVGSWAKFVWDFTPVKDFGEAKAFGLWVYGDGVGEIINLQLSCPPYVLKALQDHYIDVNFTGWRYFELVESENRAIAEYEWENMPRAVDWNKTADLGFAWAAYIWPMNYANIDSVSLWYNNLPVGKEVNCCVSPIKALPLVENKIKNPKVKIGAKEMVFPVELSTGCYIEFRSMEDCTVYNREGEIISKIVPTGEIPVLQKGQNTLIYSSEPLLDITPRAELTIITRSKQGLNEVN